MLNHHNLPQPKFQKNYQKLGATWSTTFVISEVHI
jgi:hypothetical protein